MSCWVLSIITPGGQGEETPDIGGYTQRKNKTKQKSLILAAICRKALEIQVEHELFASCFKA